MALLRKMSGGCVILVAVPPVLLAAEYEIATSTRSRMSRRETKWATRRGTAAPQCPLEGTTVYYFELTVVEEEA